MGVAERKERSRNEREMRITAAARLIAAREGWGAVTIRRLAEEIEYSQPVLYSHFRNRDAIVAAVVVQGFRELALVLRQAANSPSDQRGAVNAVATAYLTFAREHGSLYDAMFAMPTNLSFAQADTEPALKDAFAALAAVVPASISHGEVLTETVWAALHGLAELERSGRIRHGARDERVALVVNRLVNDRMP